MFSLLQYKYFQRVMMLVEVEIADMVRRRRTIPQTKYKVDAKVNTYNTFNMNVNEEHQRFIHWTSLQYYSFLLQQNREK
jgi:hypothetical protein